MNVDIISQKENPLLSRTMVTASLNFERATPSYSEALTLLATKLKVDEKLIAIRHIYSSFGERKAKLTAYVYSEVAKKQLIEPKPKENKEKKAEVPKKA